jgi:hypothetical protein
VFDRYGIWTQFDSLRDGLLASPSNGQGYALQGMILYDMPDMAAKALDWLANTTYKPVSAYKLHRSSPFYFCERMYSPDAAGKIPLAEGCGALNLVNVSEPLKISRLMLGVDDSTLAHVRIIPRIPHDWKGVEARNWPILTSHGIVRADIRFVQKNSGGDLTVELAPRGADRRSQSADGFATSIRLATADRCSFRALCVPMKDERPARSRFDSRFAVSGQQISLSEIRSVGRQTWKREEASATPGAMLLLCRAWKRGAQPVTVRE